MVETINELVSGKETKTWWTVNLFQCNVLHPRYQFCLNKNAGRDKIDKKGSILLCGEI